MGYDTTFPNQDFSPAVHPYTHNGLLLEPLSNFLLISMHWRSLPKYNYCLSLYDNLTSGALFVVIQNVKINLSNRHIAEQKNIFQLMNMDLIGPIQNSLYDNKYILTISDNNSRFGWTIYEEIQHQFTVSYHPQQNGRIERFNGINNKIPYELLTNNKVDNSNIRVFGCKVFYYIPKPFRDE
ncbi:hypothetical protein H8356DRAFT_1364740 [Neocallimastix lanati (nom. inval.)]|nr:hypothetical protein H8356DRAFT_1364740 [Neocallimastix sp. JGI-2020a]